MTFDPKKPVTTRDGRKARIIATDRKSWDNDFPMIALVEDDDTENMQTYTSDGKYLMGEPSDEDLINVPESIVRYVNVYRGDNSEKFYSGGEYNTRADADSWANKGRVSCIRVEFTEGRFDD